MRCFCFVDDVLNLIGHKHKTNKPRFSDAELITFFIYAVVFRHGDYKAALEEFREHHKDLSLSTSNSKKS